MKDIYIVGAGGFGREVLWLIQRINNVNLDWNIKGFIDDNKSIQNTTIDDYPVVGTIDDLKTIDGYVVVAIGNSHVKKNVVEIIKSISNVKFATLIDPSVIISNRVNIGEGCIICAGNIITVDITIGNHVILNLDCTVGHDAKIYDYVTINPSVNVSGKEFYLPMEHKVSIIVPIYNVEQYIRKCVDSILNQTYDNLEIILIDDGSPDKCGKICDEYAEIDSRIKVIHKKNGGLSDARNAGLKICTGKYLTFIDADDYLLPNYVADLISNIKNADICIGGYCTLYDGTVKKPKYKFERKVYSTDKKISLLEHLLLGKDNNQEFPFHLMSVWKNLYKSDFIKENNLTFVSERKIYAEDFIFNLYAYYFSKSIVLIDNANIVHLINKESLSQSYRKNYFELQKCLTKTTEEFISTYLSSDLLDEYNKRLPNMLAYSLFKENRTNKNTAVENTKKILLDPYAIDILLQFKKCESGFKESIIYYFAKHHRVKCIYYFVKMLTLGEPLYRIMRLRK